MRFTTIAGGLVACAIGALVYQGAQAAQGTVPPPTVPPPVPPTTTSGSGGRTAPPRQPEPGSIAPKAVAATSTVIGQVVDNTGRAVPAVVVRLIGQDTVDAVVSDPKGRFYFSDVPPGAFVVTAGKQGFHDGGFGQKRAGGDPLPFFVNVGQTISDMRVELFRSAVITGLVVDELNDPVVGARVVGWRRQFADGEWQHLAAATDLTDDQGRYRLHGLPPGEYIVSTPSTSITAPVAMFEAIGVTGRVEGNQAAFLQIAEQTTGELLRQVASGSSDGKYLAWTSPSQRRAETGLDTAYPTQYYPATREFVLALPVDVAAGDVRYGVDFQWAAVPARSVSGRLVGPSGGTAGQLLRLVPVDIQELGASNEAALTISLDDGSFTFLHAASGRYRLEAGRGVAASDAFWGRLEIIVDDNDVADLVVTMQPGAALSGVVAIEGADENTPAPSFSRIPIAIEPIRSGLSPSAAVRVLADGQLATTHVIPGEYRLRVGALPAGWFLKSVTAGDEDALDRPLNLETGDIADVRITLTNRRTEITGSVRDSRLEPASGATIIVLPARSATWNPNRTRQIRASTNGSFAVTGLPPGDYLIVAIDDAMAEGWQDERVLAALRTLATRISLREAENRVISLRLSPLRR